MKKGALLRQLPIQILSRYKLDEILASGGRRYSHCISIGDPGEPEPDSLRESFREILRLEFHDINKSRDMPRSEHPRPPSARDIRRLVLFLADSNRAATGYTIHCHAGVHRSVAAGLIALYLMRDSESGAKEELLKIKPLPLPNRRMIELFDARAGAGLGEVTEEMWKRLSDFLAGSIEIDSDDYLEELEPSEGPGV